MEKVEILPDALYSPLEMAEILGFESDIEDEKANARSRSNQVYKIPAKELPRTRVGGRGGKVMFRGRDILSYLDRRRRDW